jgi:hypothetical protein|tara:strand:- start:283 stop:552 length:270 start_codon:yes stop_codon:yes gene_type:complete
MSGDTNGNLMRDANAARARRLTDAALVLPFIGIILFLIPVIWPSAEVASLSFATSTSTALIYLFSVWFCLICLAAILALLIKNFGAGRG